MKLEEVFEYEVMGAGWPSRISWPWLQDMAGTYFAWKVRRKWRNYVCAKEAEARLAERANLNHSRNQSDSHQ